MTIKGFKRELREQEFAGINMTILDNGIAIVGTNALLAFNASSPTSNDPTCWCCVMCISLGCNTLDFSRVTWIGESSSIEGGFLP